MNHATWQCEWSYWTPIHLLNSTSTGAAVRNTEYRPTLYVYTCELSVGMLQMHAKSSEYSNEIRELELEHIPGNHDQPNY